MCVCVCTYINTYTHAQMQATQQLRALRQNMGGGKTSLARTQSLVELPGAQGGDGALSQVCMCTCMHVCVYICVGLC